MGRNAEHDEWRLGGDLLLRLSNEMARAQKRFFGKGPKTSKSYILDDLVITVLRGGITRAEHTLVESGHEDEVRDFRQVFENEMAEPLTRIVEEITGRKVVNFQSQVMFDPDIVVEIFVFD